MVKEDSRAVLESEVLVCGDMIEGIKTLMIKEQIRIGNGPESSYLNQLRNILDSLERKSFRAQAGLSSLDRPFYEFVHLN